ncbi:MAG: hypothetical protein Q8R47_06235 [Nanoarchaeota archaeon]|nr:hypothetical protein [Nanoarchaeota archaeon]
MIDLEEMIELAKGVRIGRIIMDMYKLPTPQHYPLTILPELQEEGWLSLEKLEQYSKDTYRNF